MLYPIPSYWSVSCSIGFLSVSCCFLASLLKGGFRPIQVILTPGSAWHKCVSHLYHYSVSECVNVWCISYRLEFQDCKDSRAEASSAVNAPFRGCRCLFFFSPARKGWERSVYRWAAWFPGSGPSAWGITSCKRGRRVWCHPERGCHLSENGGQDKSPGSLWGKDKHGVALAFKNLAF